MQARHLVFADADPSAAAASEPLSPSFLPPTPKPDSSSLRAAAGEEADDGAEGEGESEPAEWSIGARPQVERRRLSAGTPLSCRVQRDSDNDMSDNGEDDAEDGSGGSGGEEEAGEPDVDEEDELDAAELLNILESGDAAEGGWLRDMLCGIQVNS